MQGHRLRRRGGFTLVELLVVIGLITFLAALTVILGPALLGSFRASRGAEVLQGELFVAKHQALRDRVPYGIRLLPESPTQPHGPFRSFQFIQTLEDFSGGVVVVQAATPNVAQFTGVDLTGGLTDPGLYPVQPGDYIHIGGSTSALHRIASVDPATNSVTTVTSLSPTPGRTDYRIIRGPRPVAGEDTIFLPDGVIIAAAPDPNNPPDPINPLDPKHYPSLITPDVRVVSTNAAVPAQVHYDILFHPSGQVLGPAARVGKIILWVRAENADPRTDEEQTLIVVFTRTGQIAAYPVDTGGGPDPYSLTRELRPSGL